MTNPNDDAGRAGDTERFGLLEELPETLPGDPMAIVSAWIDDARARADQPNPTSMTLATADAQGRPSARIVLCRGCEPDPGYVVFYTNRRSRKGRELAANPRAALILHWDHTDRQVRIEGPAVESPDAESDAYFNARHPASRIGAWASDQSEPLGDRSDLVARVWETAQRFGIDLDTPERDMHIPRPAHWGGYRVWAERVELWVGSPVRIHDRAEWTRTLTPNPGASDPEEAFVAGAWSATRLYP